MASTPVATERYENRRLSFNWDILSWKASREFDVAFAGDENTALATVASTFGVVVGSAHDLCSTLVCTAVNADKSMLTVIRVSAAYGVPAGGAITTSLDPLTQPPLINWRPSLQSEEMDFTPDGTAVMTTAGEYFGGSVTTDCPTMTLTLTRFQPYYDPAQATRLMRTTNKDNFVIRGRAMNTAVQPGQARIKSIAPVGDYSLIAYFVKVVWTFEIRSTFTFTDSTGLSDAWDCRVPNKGRTGWYSDPDSGQPLTGGFHKVSGLGGPGEPVTDDIPLDLSGKPIDTQSIKVTVRKFEAIANPNPQPSSPQVQYEPIAANVPGGVIYIIHFKRLNAVPYAGLL